MARLFGFCHGIMWFVCLLLFYSFIVWYLPSCPPWLIHLLYVWHHRVIRAPCGSHIVAHTNYFVSLVFTIAFIQLSLIDTLHCVVCITFDWLFELDPYSMRIWHVSEQQVAQRPCHGRIQCPGNQGGGGGGGQSTGNQAVMGKIAPLHTRHYVKAHTCNQSLCSL